MSVAMVEHAGRNGTVVEFDDEPLYEEIDGVRVELLPMGVDANGIAGRIGYCLTDHARPRRCGSVYPETPFRLRLPGDRTSVRRPDVAFVSTARWPYMRAANAAVWDLAPDLAVEVVSPNDAVEELMTKTVEYFQAGVTVVWHVHPKQKTIHVYEALDRIRVAIAPGVLEGAPGMPDFRMALEDIFPVEEDPPVSAA